MLAVLIDEQRSVRNGRDEPFGTNVGGEPFVVSTKSLFETIQGSMKETYMIGPCGLNKTQRLLAINNLVKSVMEKNILDIKMMYGLGVRNNNTENHVNGGRFDDGTEGFIKIYSGLLRATMNNPTGFVVGERAIRA